MGCEVTGEGRGSGRGPLHPHRFLPSSPVQPLSERRRHSHSHNKRRTVIRQLSSVGCVSEELPHASIMRCGGAPFRLRSSTNPAEEEVQSQVYCHPPFLRETTLLLPPPVSYPLSGSDWGSFPFSNFASLLV